MKLSTAWIKYPTRTIHYVVSALIVLGTVAGALTNALNGTDTWIGAGIAVFNVLQGELNHTQVSPTTSTTGTVS